MREISPRSPVAILLIAIVLIYAGILVIAPLIAIVQGAFGVRPAPLDNRRFNFTFSR